MIEHGLRATYQSGCRCLPCRAANATYVPRAMVSAEPARAHLLALQAQGVGRRQAAALVGFSPAYVQRVRSGELVQIGAEHSAKLLAIKPIPALGSLVPSWPCRRLLVHLGREGYTPRFLRERFKVPDRTRPGRPVRAATAAKVYAVHRLVLDSDAMEVEA